MTIPGVGPVDAFFVVERGRNSPVAKLRLAVNGSVFGGVAQDNVDQVARVIREGHMSLEGEWLTVRFDLNRNPAALGDWLRSLPPNITFGRAENSIRNYFFLGGLDSRSTTIQQLIFGGESLAGWMAGDGSLFMGRCVVGNGQLCLSLNLSGAVATEDLALEFSQALVGLSPVPPPMRRPRRPPFDEKPRPDRALARVVSGGIQGEPKPKRPSLELSPPEIRDILRDRYGYLPGVRNLKRNGEATPDYLRAEAERTRLPVVVLLYACREIKLNHYATRDELLAAATATGFPLATILDFSWGPGWRDAKNFREFSNLSTQTGLTIIELISAHNHAFNEGGGLEAALQRNFREFGSAQWRELSGDSPAQLVALLAFFHPGIDPDTFMQQLEKKEAAQLAIAARAEARLMMQSEREKLEVQRAAERALKAEAIRHEAKKAKADQLAAQRLSREREEAQQKMARVAEKTRLREMESPGVPILRKEPDLEAVIADIRRTLPEKPSYAELYAVADSLGGGMTQLIETFYGGKTLADIVRNWRLAQAGLPTRWGTSLSQTQMAMRVRQATAFINDKAPEGKASRTLIHQIESRTTDEGYIPERWALQALAHVMGMDVNILYYVVNRQVAGPECVDPALTRGENFEYYLYSKDLIRAFTALSYRTLSRKDVLDRLLQHFIHPDKVQVFNGKPLPHTQSAEYVPLGFVLLNILRLTALKTKAPAYEFLERETGLSKEDIWEFISQSRQSKRVAPVIGIRLPVDSRVALDSAFPKYADLREECRTRGVTVASLLETHTQGKPWHQLLKEWRVQKGLTEEDVARSIAMKKGNLLPQTNVIKEWEAWHLGLAVPSRMDVCYWLEAIEAPIDLQGMLFLINRAAYPQLDERYTQAPTCEVYCDAPFLREIFDDILHNRGRDNPDESALVAVEEVQRDLRFVLLGRLLDPDRKYLFRATGGTVFVGSADSRHFVDNTTIIAFLKRGMIQLESIQKIAALFEFDVEDVYEFIMVKCYDPKFVKAVDDASQDPQIKALLQWLGRPKARFFLHPSHGPRQAKDFLERVDTLGGFLWLARQLNGFSLEEIGEYSHLRRQDIIAIEKNDMPYVVEGDLIRFAEIYHLPLGILQKLRDKTYPAGPPQKDMLRSAKAGSLKSLVMQGIGLFSYEQAAEVISNVITEITGQPRVFRWANIQAIGDLPKTQVGDELIAGFILAFGHRFDVQKFISLARPQWVELAKNGFEVFPPSTPEVFYDHRMKERKPRHQVFKDLTYNSAYELQQNEEKHQWVPEVRLMQMTEAGFGDLALRLRRSNPWWLLACEAKTGDPTQQSRDRFAMARAIGRHLKSRSDGRDVIDRALQTYREKSGDPALTDDAIVKRLNLPEKILSKNFGLDDADFDVLAAGLPDFDYKELVEGFRQGELSHFLGKRAMGENRDLAEYLWSAPLCADDFTVMAYRIWEKLAGEGESYAVFWRRQHGFADVRKNRDVLTLVTQDFTPDRAFTFVGLATQVGEKISYADVMSGFDEIDRGKYAGFAQELDWSLPKGWIKDHVESLNTESLYAKLKDGAKEDLESLWRTFPRVTPQHKFPIARFLKGSMPPELIGLMADHFFDHGFSAFSGMTREEVRKILYLNLRPHLLALIKEGEAAPCQPERLSGSPIRDAKVASQFEASTQIGAPLLFPFTDQGISDGDTKAHLADAGMKMQEAGGHVQISNDAPSRLALDRTADLIPSIKKRFSRPLSPFSPRAGFRSLSPLGARIGINRFAPNFFRGR